MNCLISMLVYLCLLSLVAALAERLKQPDACPEPPTRFARDACASRPNRLQGAVSFLAVDLDFPDPIQLDLLTLRDFLSERFEVALDCFADQLLGERPLLPGDQCHSVGVFHRDFSFLSIELSVKLTTDN